MEPFESLAEPVSVTVQEALSSESFLTLPGASPLARLRFKRWGEYPALTRFVLNGGTGWYQAIPLRGRGGLFPAPSLLLPNLVLVEILGSTWMDEERIGLWHCRKRWRALDLRAVLLSPDRVIDSSRAKPHKQSFMGYCETQKIPYAVGGIPMSWFREPPSVARTEALWAAEWKASGFPLWRERTEESKLALSLENVLVTPPSNRMNYEEQEWLRSEHLKGRNA